jgi:hypothetical protein
MRQVSNLTILSSNPRRTFVRTIPARYGFGPGAVVVELVEGGRLHLHLHSPYDELAHHSARHSPDQGKLPGCPRTDQHETTGKRQVQ